MGVRENIIKLRDIYNLKQRDLAEIVGLTRGAVSQWETGATVPRMGQIETIADYFGIYKSNIVEENGMDYVDPVTHKAVQPPTNIVKPVAVESYAPYVGRIAAGSPLEAIPLPDERAWVDPAVLEEHPHSGIMRVTSDSVDLFYRVGSDVLIDYDEREIINGKIYAVMVNDSDATLKELHKVDGAVVLKPRSTNKAHKIMVIDETDPDAPYFHVVGRACWHVGPME